MHVLGVVPIFMSAGAAVLPTLIAAVTSVAAILFKPRELARLVRRRPAMMSGLFGGIILAVALLGWWMATPAKAATRTITRTQKTDWSQVAKDILAQQSLHAQNDPSPNPQSRPDITGATPPASDSSRRMFSGTIAPTHLTQAWKYQPEQTMFLSDPVLSPDGKRLYVAGCNGDATQYVGWLACLNADTGKPVWEVYELHQDVMKPFFSSPALTPDGKYLLIGQGLHQDKNCSLMCFDTARGEFKWQVQTTEHIESSPAIFGDRVVVGMGAIEGTDGRATGDPGYVFAVRISDGKKLWQQAVNDPESSPVIAPDGTVYIGSGFNGNAVVALRSDTDEQLKAQGLNRILWKVPTEFPVTGPLTLIGDTVIAGGGNSDMVHSAPNAKGQVMALDRKSGNVLWNVTVQDSILGSMAAGDGMVVCPCRTGEMLGLSLKDGTLLWRARVNGNVPVVAGVAFGAGKAYGMSNDGNLAIIDTSNGAAIEKLYVNEPGVKWSGYSMSTPLVSEGKLFVATETGGVRMYVGTK